MRRLASLMMVMMMMTGAFLIPAPVASESSRDFDWSDPIRITIDSKNATSPSLALDSDNNLNIVFVKDFGNVSYKRMTPNNITIVDAVLAHSNMGRGALPRIAMGPDNDIHVTWVNETTSSPAFKQLNYLKMREDMSILALRPGHGGDELIVDDDGYAYVYAWYWEPPGGSGPPPEYVDLQYSKLDTNGDILYTNVVGTHNNSYHVADWAFDSSGGLNFVFQHNSTTMNYTRFDASGNKVIDQVPIAANPDYISVIDIAMADNDDIMVAYKTSYNLGINFTRINRTGVQQVVDKTLWSDSGSWGLYQIDMEGPDPDGTYGLVFTGEDEIGAFDTGSSMYSMEIDMNGTIRTARTHVISYCPSDYWGSSPSSAMDPFGVTHVVLKKHKCAENLGEEFAPTDLWYMNTPEIKFIDLLVKEEGVDIVGDIVIADQGFTLNTTVWNMGNEASTDFNVNVRYTDNGSLLAQEVMDLPANTHDNVSFQLALRDTTNLTIEVDPQANADVNISNNHVNITVEVSAPDLWVTSNDISFSNDQPYIDEEITISAWISNTGDVEGHAEVVFYNGAGGPEINRTGIFIVPPNAMFVNTTWVPTVPGTRTMVVVIEALSPKEVPGTMWNNTAQRDITVLENMPPTVIIQDPVQDQQFEPGPYTFKGVALDADGDDLVVDLRLDQGQWVPVEWSSISEWSLDMDLTYAVVGMHTVEARVSDGHSETTAEVDFELIDIPVPGPFLYISARIPDSSPVVHEAEHQDLSILVVHSPDCVPYIAWFLDGTEVQNGSGAEYRYNTTYDDAGLHAVTVKAACGALQDWTGWNITVLDTNRAPEIIDHRPETAIYEMKLSDTTRFNVTAIDADGDDLSYQWYLNGTLAAPTGPVYSFKPTAGGTFMLKVTVSDGKGGADTQEWEVKAKAEPPTKPVNTDVGAGLGWILLLIIIICIIVFGCVRAYQESLKEKAGRARRREMREEASDEDEFDDEDDVDGDVEDYDEEYLD